MKSLSFSRARLNGLPNRRYPSKSIKGKERIDLMVKISEKRQQKIMERLKYG